MMRTGAAPTTAFQGTRASYVALAAISTLALALLTSIWEGDVSGSTAVLGLLAVYLASTELLILYIVFTPASVVVDIIRLSISAHGLGGRGWLIFFSILEMLAKCVGAVFAWSLHKTVTSGGDAAYAPVNAAGPADSSYQRVDDPFATAYAPPRPDPASVPHAAAQSSPTAYQPPATSAV